jgi:phage/plasmid-like protein (TIGR03299 family)
MRENSLVTILLEKCIVLLVGSGSREALRLPPTARTKEREPVAHNLEQSGDQVAFALRGEPAWHGLANKTWEENTQVSTQEMLDSALLSNWNVRLEQVQFPTDYRSVSDTFMVLRDNPFDSGVDILSTVGERYKTLQNEELFSFGDLLLDGGGHWESAGSIKNGRQVFGSLVLPRDIVLDEQGANDITKTYLLVVTSHDGSSSVQAMTTPVRVVCQNTLNVAIKGAKQSFKVRHTATVQGKVQAARQALGLSFAYLDQFEAEAQALYQASVTDQQWFDLVQALYPAPEQGASKVAFTKYANKVDILNDIYHTSPTCATIKGTAWGAFNALTERLDYFRSGRKGTDEGILSAASGFDAQVNSEKGRILSAVKELLVA